MAQLRVRYCELGLRQSKGTIGDVIKERDEFVFTERFRWERGPTERVFPLPLRLRRRAFWLPAVTLGIQLNTVVVISVLECLLNGTLNIIGFRVEGHPAIIVVTRARRFEHLNDLSVDELV